MKIGVFDSGRGGEFIANGLEQLLPEHEYTVVNDRDNVPYGSRSNTEVLQLTDAAIQPLIAECSIIVIACNTATMAGITVLRERHPDTLFIGIEPMVKPAAKLSRSEHISVLATPLTLQSERYRQLVAQFASELRIDEPDATGWAAAVEADAARDIDFSELATSVNNGSDVIVLACTHYITLKDRLREQFPNVTILEPTEAIARQITALTRLL
jgi:glutamate racemase